MTHAADLLFQFPDTGEADRGFVRSALNLATVPVMALDAGMGINVMNLQCEETLLRLGAAVGDRRRKAWPPGQMQTGVKACLRSGRAQLVREIVLGIADGGRRDALICPGKVRGEPLAFVILLPSSWEGPGDIDTAFDRLLEAFDCAVVILDEDLRFRKYNTRYLTTFGLEDDEVRGRKFSERSSSEQAKVMERQISYNMGQCKVLREQVMHMSTTRHGVVFASVWSWPLYEADVGCRGTVGLMRPLAADVPSPAMDEAKEILFGRTTVRIGPPMFFTHLDGKIVIMNAAARAMIAGRDAADQSDIKTAIPWRHPEIIDKLYEDIIGGSTYSGVITEVLAPSGDRICRVDAVGLKEVGDITSEVFVHVQDMTESERLRNLLADTARSLSVEKEILGKVVATVDLTFTVIDRNLIVVRLNELGAGKFDSAPQDLIGRKVTDLSPNVGRSGLLDYIKIAIEHGRETHVPRFTHITREGDKTDLMLSIVPVRLDDEPACILITRDLDHAEKLDADVARKCDLCDLLFSSVSDGIAVINKQGGIIDVSPALVQATGWRKEDLVGREAAEIVGEMIQPPHSDLMTDYLHKALISREPVRTGCIRLTSKETGADMFVDLTAYPLLSADGDVGEIAVVVRFLTERVDLERQVGEYTENLESLVTARTKDLSSANALLEGAVSKLASLAKSGMVLGSLKDAESVMDSFLVQAKGVLAADFVSVVLVGDKVGVAKTTYYSSGEIPPPGEIPSEVVEKALAHLMLYGSASDVVKTPLNNLMVLDFAISGFRGLLLAWKRDGEFTAIDGNISRLLCTQLGFALPITTYVSQLRKERDRSHAMRRVAFRVVAAGSVGSAIRIVAGEVARAISADRFFWLVLANESDAWLSEVYATGGVSAGRPRRVTLAGSSDLRAAFEAGYDSHQMFCERFPDFGGSGFVAEKATGKVDQCPFVSKDGSLHIAGCMRGMLETAGFLMHDEGWLAAAPVALSHHSWGILCAYREAGGPFSFEDICFVCLAASTVGHMWQAVDSAGAVRRLEAAGETVSELAHDLKYPLMRMRECVAAVAGTDGPRLEADPRMGSLAFEIDRMARLAQELIDIARPGPRRAELVDINETLDYCLELTASDAAARSVDVTKRMDTELPPILASRKDIKTILLNLLANCIDAAGEGGRVEIEAKCDRGRGGPERACLILSDTGPGVSRDNLEKIFDPFYSTKGGGSGLGLFSAKKRANANDGDVECELGQDGKSRFVVWFPMASS